MFDNLNKLTTDLMLTIDFHEIHIIHNKKTGDQRGAFKENIAAAVKRAAILLAHRHEFDSAVDTATLTVEPSALEYSIETSSSFEGALPEASSYCLGVFKLEGGKRAGSRYSLSFSLDELA